jgi:RNA polymerase sigma-70 factor (ECF subfamily)
MDPIEQLIQRTLVVRCQVGERPALEELFLRHNRALGYYLGRMLDRDDVADLQQEVWLAVIRHVGRLRNPEAFVVWLYQIARRKALTRLTERRAAVSIDDEEMTAEIADNSQPPFSPADAAAIHRELAHLSEKHREVVLLRFMEDLSYDEIAEIIGCTPGTVRSRLHYAKATLRTRLEKNDERQCDA